MSYQLTAECLGGLWDGAIVTGTRPRVQKVTQVPGGHRCSCYLAAWDGHAWFWRYDGVKIIPVPTRRPA